MGEQERAQMERRIILQRWGLAVTSTALALSILLGLQAWAGLPDRVEKAENHIQQHDALLSDIREKLARIEASTDEIKRRIDRAHPTQ